MRILIVGDEIDLARALARGLRQQGYAVDIATDGKAGWEAGEVHEYDYNCNLLSVYDFANYGGPSYSCGPRCSTFYALNENVSSWRTSQ